MKKLLWAFGGGLLILVAVLGVKTLSHTSRQLDVPPAATIAIDESGLAERLAVAVRFPTIARDGEPEASAEAFERLHSHLAQAYPLTHKALKLEKFAGHSLLYTWEGTDRAAKPILLMAHQDVVPVAPGTEQDWEQPPFSGMRKDGFIWGRGTWDDKGNLIAELEAIETLIREGYKPTRTVYLAFGHDEEVASTGVVAIVKALKARKVRLDFVIDEGMVITKGMIPGIKAPVALIGVAEKGYMTLELTTRAAPGHSSMPPSPGEAAVPRLASALARLDEQQFPARIGGIAREMLETLAPEMPLANRVALSNLWLTEPLVRSMLQKDRASSAMLHTTTAETVLEAGNKENVLPGVAKAKVNFRLLPGDSGDEVLAEVKRKIADPLVDVKRASSGSEASPVTSTSSASYALVNRTVRALFPGTLVAPGIVIGGTDSRYFSDISDNVFKFTPVIANKEDLARFHGTNERLGEKNLADIARFYYLLVKDGAGSSSASKR